MSDVALAEEIGVSRTPVREAISQLESEGLVQQVPRYGAFVKTISRKELEELYELRGALEGFAAAQAARKITDLQVGELRHLVKKIFQLMKQASTEGLDQLDGELGRQLVLADVAFHLFVLHVADNQRVMKIVGDFRILTETLGTRRGRMTFTVADLAEIHRQHRHVLRGIARRDPDAARRAMELHHERGAQRVLNRFDQYQAEQKAGLASSTSAEWPEALRDVISAMEAAPVAHGVPVIGRRSARGRRKST